MKNGIFYVEHFKNCCLVYVAFTISVLRWRFTDLQLFLSYLLVEEVFHSTVFFPISYIGLFRKIQMDNYIEYLSQNDVNRKCLILQDYQI